MPAGWALLAVLLVGCGTTAATVDPPEVYSLSSGDLGLAITDHNNTTSSVAIDAGNVGTVEGVVMRVRLDHTFLGDLRITLIAPSRAGVVVIDRRGSSGNNLGTGATDCTGTATEFSDSAATPVADGAAPFEGTFRPDTELATLAGSDLAGGWTLIVGDFAGGDQGTLYCWEADNYYRAP